jgi:L-fucose isomerase
MAGWEALENHWRKPQMKMALNVATMYEKVLKYPDGSSVQCVVADSCIGGVHEAARCAKKFEASTVVSCQ